MINRQVFAYFDWKPILLVGLIFFIGVSSIYSVTYHLESPLYIKQIYWILIGLGIFLVMLFFDYREMARYAYFFYVLVLVMLIMVYVGGRMGGGAKRWISLGGFSFQPSEMAKIAVIMTISKYFSDHISRKHGKNYSPMTVPFLLICLYLFLIFKQPDLGTALSVFFIFIPMVLLVGIRSKYIWGFVIFVIILSPFLGRYFWGHLKEYQKQRIITFINPSSDPKGKGYHIQQSKISIGSGKLTGKGFLGGTQSQLDFLPASHTDFIFAVYAEEWGFAGVFILFTLYFLLLLWGIDVILKAKDLLGIFIASGVVCMMATHVFINAGMTLGIMPVVGIPLPFMSYGGTSIISNMIGLGLLMNVKMRRLMFY